MSKKLFVVISNGGDGSYYPQFTLDEGVIARLEEMERLDTLYDKHEHLCDGDGFHYSVLTVPDDASYESLGIKYPFNPFEQV